MEVLTGSVFCLGVLFLFWCTKCVLLRPSFAEEHLTLLRLSGDAPLLEKQVRYLRWMQNSGMQPWPAVLVDCGMTPDARKRAEILATEDLFLHLVAEDDLFTYFDFMRADHGTGI